MHFRSFFILFSFMILLPGKLFDMDGTERDQELISYLSPEEKKIHFCLQKASSDTMKVRCLKGSPYEVTSGRIPSSDGSALIDKLQWFFSSHTQKLSFYKFIDVVKKSGRFFNSYGAGVSGEAYFGIGKSWMAEIIRHNDQLALFCAPGITGKTDAGISAGLTALRSISCRSNAHYAGNFFSVSAGVSGELIGLPLGVGLNYSFGTDIKSFNNRLKEARKNGSINSRELNEEMIRLGSINPVSMNKETASLLFFGAKLVSLAYPSLQYKKSLSRNNLSVLKNSLSKRISLGLAFKEFIYSRDFQDFFQHHDLPNLRNFFLILGKSFSGCDSMGGGASLSLSLSPASIGVSYTNYNLLYEFSSIDTKELPKISPLILLNPSLMGLQELQFISRNARSILALPQKISQSCH